MGFGITIIPLLCVIFASIVSIIPSVSMKQFTMFYIGVFFINCVAYLQLYPVVVYAQFFPSLLLIVLAIGLLGLKVTTSTYKSLAITFTMLPIPLISVVLWLLWGVLLFAGLLLFGFVEKGRISKIAGESVAFKKVSNIKNDLKIPSSITSTICLPFAISNITVAVFVFLATQTPAFFWAI